MLGGLEPPIAPLIKQSLDLDELERLVEVVSDVGVALTLTPVRDGTVDVGYDDVLPFDVQPDVIVDGHLVVPRAQPFAQDAHRDSAASDDPDALTVQVIEQLLACFHRKVTCLLVISSGKNPEVVASRRNDVM